MNLKECNYLVWLNKTHIIELQWDNKKKNQQFLFIFWFFAESFQAENREESSLIRVKKLYLRILQDISLSKVKTVENGLRRLVWGLSMIKMELPMRGYIMCLFNCTFNRGFFIYVAKLMHYLDNWRAKAHASTVLTTTRSLLKKAYGRRFAEKTQLSHATVSLTMDR